MALLNKVKNQELSDKIKALFLNNEPSIVLFKPKEQLQKAKLK